MSRRFGTVPFISGMFVNHSTDEGHSAETSGHLLRFWHFQQHSQLLFSNYRIAYPRTQPRVALRILNQKSVPSIFFILVSILSADPIDEEGDCTSRVGIPAPFSGCYERDKSSRLSQ